MEVILPKGEQHKLQKSNTKFRGQCQTFFLDCQSVDQERVPRTMHIHPRHSPYLSTQQRRQSQYESMCGTIHSYSSLEENEAREKLRKVARFYFVQN